MHNAISIFFTIVIITCLPGCDPARVLTIKTSGKPNVSASIYGDRDILPKNYNIPVGKIVINFSGADSQKKDTSFSYGIGVWTNESITAITDKIDSIIINNSSGKIILKTKAAIKSYLADHRSGYRKSRITIEAK